MGLARYPETVVADDGRCVRTNLEGWRWSGFCKTQYASNPRLGGFDNFRRAHVGLIELLDHAQELGIATTVHDEGHYAEHRDIERLRQEIGRWNTLLTGFVGRLKDALPAIRKRRSPSIRTLSGWKPMTGRSDRRRVAQHRG